MKHPKIPSAIKYFHVARKEKQHIQTWRFIISRQMLQQPSTKMKPSSSGYLTRHLSVRAWSCCRLQYVTGFGTIRSLSYLAMHRDPFWTLTYTAFRISALTFAPKIDRKQSVIFQNLLELENLKKPQNECLRSLTYKSRPRCSRERALTRLLYD